MEIDRLQAFTWRQAFETTFEQSVQLVQDDMNSSSLEKSATLKNQLLLEKSH
jgi:hypothetical protein